MNFEFLKYGTGITVILAAIVSMVKVFYLSPKELKEHSEKHEKHDKELKLHSDKIIRLEANDENREKTVDKIHETLTLLNASIMQLNKKL